VYDGSSSSYDNVIVVLCCAFSDPFNGHCNCENTGYTGADCTDEWTDDQYNTVTTVEDEGGIP